MAVVTCWADDDMKRILSDEHLLSLCDGKKTHIIQRAVKEFAKNNAKVAEKSEESQLDVLENLPRTFRVKIGA